MKVSNKNAIQFIRNNETFSNHGGTFSGSKGFPSIMGRLPNDYQIQISEFYQEDRIDYTIYSYNTPIAYKVNGNKWIMPKVRYSNTTSRHQGIVKDALRYEDIEI